MLYREYEDLNELFYNFTREVLLDDNMLQKGSGFKGDIGDGDVLLKCNSMNYSMDISKMVYHKEKFPHLLNMYLDVESWIDFKNNIKNNTASSVTFHFKSRKKKTNCKVNDQGCIISLTLSRKNNKKPFNKLNVNWRASEFPRKFSVDLIMIIKLMEDLGDIVNINEIFIYIINPYLHLGAIIPTLSFFDLKMEDLGKNKACDYIKKSKELYFSDPDDRCSYLTIRRLHDYYFNKDVSYPPVNMEDLKLNLEI